MKVKLIGGPFDGAEIEAAFEDPTLVLTGGSLPEGWGARYCPTREKNVYCFCERDRIVEMFPFPPKVAW